MRNGCKVQTDEKVASSKSYRESLLQNVNPRVCWWEWSKGDDDDQTEDYGVETDFAKVLNPSDGVTIDVSNPLCPKFCFEEKEKERLLKPFWRTLVVKLLGRQPSYGFMIKKLRQLWEWKGSMDIFDLQNDFYLVNFQHAEDYMEALTGGPWVIHNAYLNVARWKPDFNPKNARIETVVAWVRFPNFPAPLFDKKFLLNLGNVIGKTIKLDIHTAQRAHGKFARMCIELDLTKPLVPEFEVEGHALSVVYESLGMLCTRCGMFGHVKEGCEDLQCKKNEMRVDVENVGDKKRGDEGSKIGKDNWQIDSNVDHGKVLKEVLTKELKKQGKQGTLSEIKKSSMGSKVKNMDTGEQSRKIVLEGKSKKAAAQGKMKTKRIPLGEVQQVTASIECVPETNLEVYRSREVGSRENENLHLGEVYTGVNYDADMELETTMHEKGIEPTCDCNGMVYENEYAMLELADDRGAASKGVAAVIRDMRRCYKIDVVVILEPRISGSNANKTIKGDQFLHCSMCMGEVRLLFTAIYANLNVQRRHRLREELQKMSENVSEPWLLAGDFNEFKSLLEQKGGRRVNETRCRRFNDWIQDCELLDIEASGPFFTWRGPKWDGLERVFKRLNCCLCNMLWQETFAKAEVKVVLRIGSNHVEA
ncbi:hypothetical protein K1719_015627 [Acacia pycnantha]|nr:hypothetical protein K1719_015627 [Acacia pycnantha]